MKMFGGLKVYLIGPELPIENLAKDLKLFDVRQIIIESEEEIPSKPKNEPKKKPAYVGLFARRQADKKNFSKFFDECCMKSESSYLNTADMHKAYSNWIANHHAGSPVTAQTMGKYAKQCKKVRTLRSKADNGYQNLYLDITLKDSSKSTTKVGLGEIYKFYKKHYVPENPPCDKIPLDEVYSVYKEWCKEQGTQPVIFNTFSKSTRFIVKKSHLEFHGKSPKGGNRRWLVGYKFRTPISK